MKKEYKEIFRDFAPIQWDPTPNAASDIPHILRNELGYDKMASELYAQDVLTEIQPPFISAVKPRIVKNTLILYEKF